MPDISTITLPSGNIYNIKDTTAREMIAALQNVENILSTNAATTPYGVTWGNNGVTITGTLVASSETIKKIYLVPNNKQKDKNVFDEYLTLKVNSTDYTWEKIGNTESDISGLGDLAYKDSATTSYTPAGTIVAPTVTLSKINIQTINDLGALPSCVFPEMTTTVTNENLTIGWVSGTFDAGALPTKNAAVSVATDVNTVSDPIFNGTQVNITVT